MDVSIGARIKAARTAAGMTQMDVARRTDLSLQAVGDIERGIVRDPHISSLRQIAYALGVSVEMLVNEEMAVPAFPLGDFEEHAAPSEERTAQEWAWRQNARLHGMDSETWDDYLRAHDTVEELGETWKEIYDESGMLHAALSADKWQRPQEQERRRKLAQGLRELRMGRYANLQARAMLLHDQALVDEIFAAMSEEANA